MIEEFEQNDKTSSIKVSKGMQGKYSFDVKLYFGLEEDEKAIVKRIKEIHNKLEEDFKNE